MFSISLDFLKKKYLKCASFWYTHRNHCWCLLSLISVYLVSELFSHSLFLSFWICFVSLGRLHRFIAFCLHFQQQSNNNNKTKNVRVFPHIYSVHHAKYSNPFLSLHSFIQSSVLHFLSFAISIFQLFPSLSILSNSKHLVADGFGSHNFHSAVVKRNL